MPRASQSLPSIYRQEDCTGQRQCTSQAGPLSQGLSHAHDARGNQQGICNGAEQHHAAYMLTTQALAQYECVLRADGHNQRQAQGHALEGNGKGKRSGGRQSVHGLSLPVFGDEDKLPFLTFV